MYQASEQKSCQHGLATFITWSNWLKREFDIEIIAPTLDIGEAAHLFPSVWRSGSQGSACARESLRKLATVKDDVLFSTARNPLPIDRLRTIVSAADAYIE